MKDTRFVELVNLYIDRQISAPETAELELEIQSNPRHREIYLQYCRMHRATKLVYESFRAEGASEPAAPARPIASLARLETHRRQRRRAFWAYAASGLAAAACFALVISRINTQTTAEFASATPPSVETGVLAPQTVVAMHAAPGSSAAPVHAQPVAAAGIDYRAMVAALREEEERLMALPRAGSQPMTASLFDDGVFDTRSGAIDRTPPQTRPRQPRAQLEFTAFQFQR